MRRGLYRHARQWGREITLLDLPFTSIADPRDLANAGGLGGIFGVPDFLWVAGDGNAPTIGPALSVTGTPTVGATPYQLRDGSDVVSEDYATGSYRTTATAVDPALADDMVLNFLFKPQSLGSARYLATRNAARGWMIYRTTPNPLTFYFNANSAANITMVQPVIGGWHLFTVVVDRDGNITPYLNGIAAGAPVACPAGSVAGEGLGINNLPNGTWPAVSSIYFVSMHYAVGIADTWTAPFVRGLANRFLGQHPEQGDTPTFARNSAASWEDHNGIWHIASQGLPRAGDSKSLRSHGVARTNKCYNTINPQAVTGWSVTGGTHTFPSDATQLLADGLQNCGPNVHQFVPGGSDQVIYGGAVSANTNAHSSSVFMRGTAGGESVDIVARDSSAGTVTNLGTVVLTTSWVRYIIDGWTPADTDEQFGLDCDAGDTILFIASQLEEGATATTPIPNYATATTATRAAEVLTTAQALSDAKGKVEAKLTPMGFSASDIVGSPVVLDRATTSTLLMYMNSAGWRAGDGTNTVTAGTPTDGVENTVKTQWKTGSLSIESDGVRDSGDYDGALTGSGNLTVEPGEEMQVKDLRVYE